MIPKLAVAVRPWHAPVVPPGVKNMRQPCRPRCSERKALGAGRDFRVEILTSALIASTTNSFRDFWAGKAAQSKIVLSRTSSGWRKQCSPVRRFQIDSSNRNAHPAHGRTASAFFCATSGLGESFEG